MASGLGGLVATIDIDGVRVFVKSIPLSEDRRRGGSRDLAALSLAPMWGPGQTARRMHITASAISLVVDDVAASAAFLSTHFGFTEAMSADGFVSLTRPDAGFNVIYLKVGLSTLKPEYLKTRKADGLLVVFVVEDIDSEYARLQREGAPVLTPIETEAWGERYFQVRDPNGVIIQLVQWM